jgi:hypothetical protein
MEGETGASGELGMSVARKVTTGVAPCRRAAAGLSILAWLREVCRGVLGRWRCQEEERDGQGGFYSPGAAHGGLGASDMVTTSKSGHGEAS